MVTELKECYPKGGGQERPPIGVERMIRMYVAQQCFEFSDEGIEEAIYDSQAVRRFVGIDLAREAAPDATTLLKFRRRLERHGLTKRIFKAINAHLASQGLLLREGSIVDATLIAASARRQRDGGAPIEALVKWNSRAGGAAVVIERVLADDTLAWHHSREGKRTAVFEDTLERRGGDAEGIRVRHVLAVNERTIDRHGQHQLVAQYELQGYLTTLPPEAADAETVIALYREHATHEQFHSELKSDLDLERLPSGKFATNDLVCSLAALAYNVLRMIGQNALTGEDAPPRHPAKRRRLRTVIQELMNLAAAVSQHARQRLLVFGAHCPALACFRRLHRQWASVP